MNFNRKPFTSNSETREHNFIKEKFKPDSMLNYTSENFNPITQVTQERKRYKNFGKVNGVSAFMSAAN